MKDYTILKIEQNNIVMVVIHTFESPFDYLQEIADDLREIGYSGTVVFDELLHSGNNDERFISGFFDGDSFDNSKFRFEKIAKRSVILSYICNYLKSDLEVLNYSSLTDKQQKLISHGCVI